MKSVSSSRKYLFFGSSLFTVGTIAISGISGILNLSSVKAEGMITEEMNTNGNENSLSSPEIQINQGIAQEETGKNKYLDLKNYESNSYEPPSKVIVTERRSHCQTIVEQGRMITGECTVSHEHVNRQNRISREEEVSSGPSTRAFNPYRDLRVHLSRDPERFNRRPISPNIEIASASLGLRSRNIAGLETAPLNDGYPQLGLEAVPLQYTRATVNPTEIDHRTSLLFPLPIPGVISSAFGWRVHPITGVTRPHTGTDIAVPEGTPVLAAYPGQVETAGWSDGYGLMISLLHERGTQESRYAHLSQIYVQIGEWIEQGAIIGRVGSTGMATGPHLHFEWRHLTAVGSIPVDAGVHLEYALNNLIYSLEKAQSSTNINHG